MSAEHRIKFVKQALQAGPVTAGSWDGSQDVLKDTDLETAREARWQSDPDRSVNQIK